MNLNPFYHLRRYRELEERNSNLVKRVVSQSEKIDQLKKEKGSLESKIVALRKEIIEKDNCIIQLNNIITPKAVISVSKKRKEKRRGIK